MTIECRPAVADDAEAITACVHAAYEPYLERMNRAPAPMLDDYPGLIDRGVVHVAERAGELVGLIVLWAEADHLYVDNIAVAPAAQGEGVGATLLALADAAARAADRGEIRLYTNEVMTENLAYYPKVGFTETHRAMDNGYHRVYFSRPVAPHAPLLG